MKVDIWSDIRCPFCYIGKRKFEAALHQFEHKDSIEVIWHSFQLDPSLETDPTQSVYNYLAERKGATREWSVRVHQQVAQTAKEVGLTYNFDKSVVANSFDAHRLIQMAKAQGLGDAAEENLFKAHFTEGKNIDDHATLVQIGTELGLEASAVEAMLSSDLFSEKVRSDEIRAESIGIAGVPFFVINDRYAVSGAQPSAIFLKGLQQAWKEYEDENLIENLKEADTG